VSKKKKKEFVSNVTGEAWQKNSAKNWKKVIDQIGVIIEDEVHKGKNNTTVILEAGSEVIIDDIRGRIKPQYRVEDKNGKIWFVTATNVQFLENNNNHRDGSENVTNFAYRGGVRVDGTEDDLGIERYDRPLTTEEEIKRGEKNG